MLSERYHRSILMFGAAGQTKIGETTVSVVGAGGLGCMIVQHLILLGVKRIYIVDFDNLDETSRNRFVAVKATDKNGVKKAYLLKRLAQETNPDVLVEVVDRRLESEEAFNAVLSSDFVFGCLDHDGPRLILNELCSAYKKPYIDLASDVLEDGAFGGRVVLCVEGRGCLSCADVLDRSEIQGYFETEDQKSARQKIYGVNQSALDRKGPSVSPLNGVVASLGVMEFIGYVTSRAASKFHLEYRGHLGTVMKSNSPDFENCRICKQVHGSGKLAQVERFINT